MTQPEDSKEENTNQSQEDPKEGDADQSQEDPEEGDANQSEKGRRISPPEVKNRLQTWLRIWIASIVIHYFFGIGGIICSTMAAAQWPTVNYGRVFAILSGVCFAIIGFVRPEQRYLGFVRAWRKLSNAEIQYIHRLIDLERLLKLMEALENDVTDVEFDTPIVPRTTANPDLKQS